MTKVGAGEYGDFEDTVPYFFANDKSRADNNRTQARTQKSMLTHDLTY